MLLLDTMGMVVLDDVSCLHEDGGAGSCCMMYMEMMVLAHVVCSTWGWWCWMMLSVRLYVVHGDITRYHVMFYHEMSYDHLTRRVVSVHPQSHVKPCFV